MYYNAWVCCCLGVDEKLFLSGRIRVYKKKRTWLYERSESNAEGQQKVFKPRKGRSSIKDKKNSQYVDI